MTGDTVYPGRLYVEDMLAFVTSLNGSVDLARSRGVTRVMSCHIEMRNTAGADYPVGSRYQPAEAALPMTVHQLIAGRDAASSIRHRPGRHNFDDFIIHHGPCRMATLHQHLRRLFAPAAGKANGSSASYS
jgi:hydroxyacylglutathione hydrolase